MYIVISNFGWFLDIENRVIYELTDVYKENTIPISAFEPHEQRKIKDIIYETL